MTPKRLRCKSCNSWLVPWGKTSSGKKRFHCKKCGASRTFRKKPSGKTDFFLLFREYILWGITYSVLAKLSGYSIQYLVVKFHRYLEVLPPTLPLFDQSTFEEKFLLIDGLWFGRYFVLMVYRQSKNLTILHISVAGKEVESKISKDLLRLKENGYIFTGIISDGGTGIVKAINRVYAHVPHQICLAHMYRDIVSAIGKRPKDYRTMELRNLADHVWLIESKEALRWWTKQVEEWRLRNWKFLMEYHRDETGRWWYVHHGLRKALRILISLSQTSFVFLDYPLMPKTTNEIEAQFGHLGKRWLAHRGLKKERWAIFLNWFVYFYNEDKLSGSKRKKD